MLCVTLVRGVVGGDLPGVYGLSALAAAPAVALGESVWAGVCWCRKGAARLLRRAAEVLDAAPVAEVASYPVAEVRRPVVLTLPTVVAPVLAMPSAARETAPAPTLVVATVVVPDYAALVKQYGSQRAAAEFLGIAVSTFRGRMKRQLG